MDEPVARYFRVDFEIRDAGALAALTKMAAALADEKVFLEEVEATSHDLHEVCAEERWRDLLSPDARKYFDEVRELSPEEREVYQKLWDLTPPEVRLVHPMFDINDRWHFESLILAILSAEYLLHGVESDGVSGVLLFDPWGYPFGSSEALVELVQSFGHRVTLFDWGGGTSAPTPRVVGWDFKKAKRLVARSRGVSA